MWLKSCCYLLFDRYYTIFIPSRRCRRGVMQNIPANICMSDRKRTFQLQQLWNGRKVWHLTLIILMLLTWKKSCMWARHPFFHGDCVRCAAESAARFVFTSPPQGLGLLNQYWCVLRNIFKSINVPYLWNEDSPFKSPALTDALVINTECLITGSKGIKRCRVSDLTHFSLSSTAEASVSSQNVFAMAACNEICRFCFNQWGRTHSWWRKWNRIHSPFVRAPPQTDAIDLPRGGGK